jgi:hypothetical protein
MAKKTALYNMMGTLDEVSKFTAEYQDPEARHANGLSKLADIRRQNPAFEPLIALQPEIRALQSKLATEFAASRDSLSHKPDRQAAFEDAHAKQAVALLEKAGKAMQPLHAKEKKHYDDLGYANQEKVPTMFMTGGATSWDRINTLKLTKYITDIARAEKEGVGRETSGYDYDHTGGSIPLPPAAPVATAKPVGAIR